MQIVINTSDEDDAVMQPAIGYLLHPVIPPTPATEDEVKEFLMTYLNNSVMDSQRQQHYANAEPIPITPE